MHQEEGRAERMDRRVQRFLFSGQTLESSFLTLWLIAGVAFLWLVFVVQMVRMSMPYPSLTT